MKRRKMECILLQKNLYISLGLSLPDSKSKLWNVYWYWSRYCTYFLLFSSIYLSLLFTDYVCLDKWNDSHFYLKLFYWVLIIIPPMWSVFVTIYFVLQQEINNPIIYAFKLLLLQLELTLWIYLFLPPTRH